MELTPAKFLSLFLVFCGIGWILFTFTAKLLAWMLSRLTGTEVRFRIGGLNSWKDISVKFKKGSIESLMIGELRISLQRPFYHVDGGKDSRFPKLQIFLSDSEVIIREKKKHASQKPPSFKRSSAARGKWMILAHTAKYLTITAMELVVQVPRWTLVIKEIDLSMYSEQAGLSLLGMKLMLLTCNVFDREKCNGFESCNLSLRERLLSVAGLASMTDKALNPLSIEQFIIVSSIGYDREKGVTVRHADLVCGELTLDISDELFQTKMYSTKKTSSSDSIGFDQNYSMSDVNSHDTNQEKETIYTSFVTKIPEKASFSLPKIVVKCHHNMKGIYVENEVNGIQVSSVQSQLFEDTGGISRLDIHMDCSEFQMFREGEKSAVEILKVAVAVSFEIPKQSIIPWRVEADIKLGGAQCNMLLYKLENWLVLTNLFKRRDMILEGKSPLSMQKQKSKTKWNLCWTCTLSAPEMSVSVCNLDGVVFSNACLQTSHVFLNSVLDQGITAHAELGEVCVYALEEVCQCPTDNLFGVDTNPGCLLQMSRVTLDWGMIDSQGIKNELGEKVKTLDLEVIGSVVYMTLERLQSILSFSIDCAAFAKRLLGSELNPKSRKETIHRQKDDRKGVKFLNLSMEGVAVHFCEQLEVIEVDVPDPKKINYGNQGGEVIIRKNSDGSIRTANISVASFNGIKGDCLQYKMYMDIARLSLRFNRSKGDSRVVLEKLILRNQELGPNDKIITEMTLLSLQSAIIIHRTLVVAQGTCSRYLLCAADLTGRWEPDVHLLFHNIALKVKSILRKQTTRIKPNVKKFMQQNAGDSTRETIYKSHNSLQNVQKLSQTKLIAVDIARVRISAALADGVEGLLSVESVFSEDITIGVVVENLRISLNSATVMKNERFQIARLPSLSRETGGLGTSNELVKSGNTSDKCWDYLIQGSGICLILPYRLECRAIEDAIEDMVRGLKLIMVAQRQSISVSDNSSVLQQGKQRSSYVGSVKFIFHNISAEMEEEPLQGWLDEHYEMIKQQSCELAVRERLLEQAVADGESTASQNPSPESGTQPICMIDSKCVDFSEQRQKLQQHNFQAYFKACQKLQAYESSGSCRSALQEGFTPSVSRGHLLLVGASALDVTLADIKGGKAGMIEQIRRLDCVSPELEIPFSKVYGKHVTIFTSSLEVKLRNYTFPMVSTSSGKCEGYILFARQATCFPNQVLQEVYIGRWRKLRMLRSESGTTPPFKMYSELPIEFEKADVAYGVGFEPALADVSYAFTVALRKANLSVHDVGKVSMSSEIYSASLPSKITRIPPLKKERSLPWWDDMRYYVHGKNSITSTNFKLIFLATTNPYEKRDMMKIVADLMEIQQLEGQLSFSAKDFDIFISSLESLVLMQGSKQPSFNLGQSFIHSPFFHLDISMTWDCESGSPLQHYLHALPKEITTREKVYDPFRSTSLTLDWKFFLKTCPQIENRSNLLVNLDGCGCKSKQHVSLPAKKVPTQKVSKDMACSSVSTNTEDLSVVEVPIMNLGGHDLIWIFKWWALYYNPPHKLRSFSKWPRFGVLRLPRSGNLSLDKVLTEFMLSVDAAPACIKHASLVKDDPAEGLTFNMNKLKYELCYSRGKQRYTFGTKRDVLELVYQGLDLLTVNAELRSGSMPQTTFETTEHSDGVAEESSENLSQPNKRKELGFLLSTEYFTLRKQAPKANPMGLPSWKEGVQGFTSSDTAYGETDFACGSGSDPTRSDPSDDDGFNVVLPDNCLRVCLYGLKLLWTIENRDAVWAWVEDISRAFESPKPSPSRQYSQRKLIEKQNNLGDVDIPYEEWSRSTDSPKHNKASSIPPSPSWQERVFSPLSSSKKAGSLPSDSYAFMKEDWSATNTEEGTMHFMVNVVQPQFNLHSEDARGRFLLAAASGRVIARSFHSILYVRPEVIEHALKLDEEHQHGTIPELTWKRRELSVILEHVQAHVAPTDVDPGAGLQWLPKIPTGAPKVKRTGALLERVFMPCAMYFQYTRYKSGTADLKLKPLKELSFNSPKIAATMTSRQFQVMVDVISNLLLARLPKPRKASFLQYGDEDLSIEEEADEVVPDGIEEVELARIKLEQVEREFKILFDDLRRLSQVCEPCKVEATTWRQEEKCWMVSSDKTRLARRLEDELGNMWKARKLAAISLRNTLKRAAQQRFTEKEKNKSPSFAMRISWAIDKVVWSMLSDGETFAEAEISSMILNVDRDYHDVGVAQFTVKYFVVRNCLPNAKSNTLLSAWNPPAEWGRNVMLRVDARQGAPKDGHSALELFQVEIYPLKIYLIELMYRMMWDYLFPEEDQDIQRRQVWKASTTAVVKRGKRVTSSSHERSTSNNVRREEASSKVATFQSTLGSHPFISNDDVSRIQFRITAKALEKHASTLAKDNISASEHCGTTSSDRTWEENLPETPSLEAVPKAISKYGSSNHPGDVESGFQKNTSGSANAESIRLKEIGRPSKLSKSSSHEDKKPAKSTSQEEKKEARIRQKNLEFYNIKISQVELLVTYEGSRFAVSDLRLLMDTFTRAEFTGTWRRLFSRVKKHIIWSVLKSVAGMQGKKFKDKVQSQGQGEGATFSGSDSDSSDSGASHGGIYDHFPISQFKRHADRAGEGFVSSIRGLFNSQRRKAKALVLRTMGVEGDVNFQGDCSESEPDAATISRQLSISKAKKLLRRHTKKFLSARHRGGILYKDQPQASPSTPPFESGASSDASSCYEDFND